ncbi:MAG: DUF4238 domain-containing protein [bacterium]
MREISIADVCLQRDIYTMPGETAEERMLLEKFYADNYESQYDKIYQLLTDPKKKTITDDERELIISTVVTMFYRTTKWISQHNELMNRVFEQAFYLCQQTGKNYFTFEGTKISIAGKTQEQLQKENKIESRPAQVITQLDTALKLIKLRTKRDGISVSKLDDADCEFVTSDNPVSYNNLNLKHVAPFDPSNILTLPLDSKHKLFLMPHAKENEKHYLARHNVRGTMCYSEKLTSNYEQSRNAERFMLGNESALLSYLETKEETEKPLPEKEVERSKKAFNEILERAKKLGII